MKTVWHRKMEAESLENTAVFSKCCVGGIPGESEKRGCRRGLLA